ncbi:immunity 21 family protein [Streptomyces sp. RKAG293]|uniref:immunity 21 family protein n=1 Tax=Streptomyces sp. RKAG293 TaxID=2893403 RepID=UPI0020334597|nr:immunity 21 family protein [Streptomyces sp. RKAG293]MCM2416648.1 immunity 21 family protein [Streptomyces sp. RKAG293]MCM2424132.1 immunity 21 family protein [Streptomyces sp. RKAG293]
MFAAAEDVLADPASGQQECGTWETDSPAVLMDTDQAGQTAPLGQAYQRLQTAVGDQGRVIERRQDRCGGMGGLHVRDALLYLPDGTLEKSHPRRSQGISLFPRPTLSRHQPVHPGSASDHDCRPGRSGRLLYAIVRR